MFRYFELKLQAGVAGHWESKIVFLVFAFRKSTRGEVPSKLSANTLRLPIPSDVTIPRLLTLSNIKVKVTLERTLLQCNAIEDGLQVGPCPFTCFTLTYSSL